MKFSCSDAPLVQEALPSLLHMVQAAAGIFPGTSRGRGRGQDENELDHHQSLYRVLYQTLPRFT